jgi:hypothetical protein
MKSSTQYREFAEECLRLAKQANDQRHRRSIKLSGFFFFRLISADPHNGETK